MKAKLSNLWYYYKWYILVILFSVIVLVNFLYEKMHTVVPDYQVAIVTKEYVAETVRDKLELILEEAWDDANRDGKTCVTVYLYNYDADTENAMDVNAFMASAVQLAADLKTQSSIWYITDSPNLLKEADGDLQVIGTWSNYVTLMDVEHTDLSDFVILERKERKQELSDSLS